MKIDYFEPHFARLQYLISNRGWTTMDSDTMEFIAKRAECDFFHGVSKGCFLHKDWDFVIKIPYYGCEASTDYCAEEEIAYLTIKEKYPLCAKLFAEIQYLEDWGEIRVYAQEKVPYSADELYFNHTHEYNNFLNYAKRFIDNSEQAKEDFDAIVDSRLSKMFVGAVLKTYGYKIFTMLRDWIVDTEQTDLHGSNVGFTSDLRPIIFDYSNWWD